jgi:hypothetical protein
MPIKECCEIAAMFQRVCLDCNPVKRSKSPMPLKIFALVPSERSTVCTHALGFSWNGRIPCTGVQRCSLCGEAR